MLKYLFLIGLSIRCSGGIPGTLDPVAVKPAWGTPWYRECAVASYWPMTEGSGTNFYDSVANVTGRVYVVSASCGWQTLGGQTCYRVGSSLAATETFGVYFGDVYDIGTGGMAMGCWALTIFYPGAGYFYRFAKGATTAVAGAFQYMQYAAGASTFSTVAFTAYQITGVAYQTNSWDFYALVTDREHKRVVGIKNGVIVGNVAWSAVAGTSYDNTASLSPLGKSVVGTGGALQTSNGAVLNFWAKPNGTVYDALRIFEETRSKYGK